MRLLFDHRRNDARPTAALARICQIGVRPLVFGTERNILYSHKCLPIRYGASSNRNSSRAERAIDAHARCQMFISYWKQLPSSCCCCCRRRRRCCSLLAETAASFKPLATKRYRRPASQLLYQDPHPLQDYDRTAGPDGHITERVNRSTAGGGAITLEPSAQVAPSPTRIRCRRIDRPRPDRLSSVGVQYVSGSVPTSFAVRRALGP
jgi:hypothetical protein